MLATRTVIGFKISHVAIWLALIALAFALPALLNPKKFKEAMMEFLNANNVVMRIAAMMNFLIAFFLLNTHKGLSFNTPRSFIALAGWLLVARGVMWLWFPDSARSMMKRVVLKPYGTYLMAGLAIVFALGFGYLGIWVY